MPKALINSALGTYVLISGNTAIRAGCFYSPKDAEDIATLTASFYGLLLAGDQQSGADILLLAGDQQSGADTFLGLEYI
jgi:hypothetical protein